MEPRALKTVATIEARMTSTRLPGKVLADLDGLPALAVMVGRLKLVSELDDIVVATTVNASDDPIEALARELGIGIWRGSEDDVLQRVLDAAVGNRAKVIVELTGDCPLIDPAIVSKVVRHYWDSGVDYVSNVLERSYPIGMDTQVFATGVLADVARRTHNPNDHEHVSLYIYRNPSLYSLSNVRASEPETRPELRLTLDTPEDLAVIRSVHAGLRPIGEGYALADMLAFLDGRPQIAAINARVAHRWT
jgi:spore coat polysaccharide biosynthesis protein SpsF